MSGPTRPRRRTAKVRKGEFGRKKAGEVAVRIRGLVEREVVELAPHLADSHCKGFVTVSFWTGGRVGEDLASFIVVSPGLDPTKLAPYLRSHADALEGRVEGVPPVGEYAGGAE